MRDADIIFDCVDVLHSRCHKINLKYDGSYTDPPDWIEIFLD